MKRYLSLAIAALLLAIGLLHQGAALAQGAAGTAPEARAAAFYAWFLKNDGDQGYPLDLPGITDYVSRKTVDRVKAVIQKGELPGDVDYFLKVQDYDGEDWAAHIATHPVVMLDPVAVVPVTLGSKDKVNLLVFMEKQGGVWKVTKVDDTLGYE